MLRFSFFCKELTRQSKREQGNFLSTGGPVLSVNAKRQGRKEKARMTGVKCLAQDVIDGQDLIHECYRYYLW